MSDRVAYRSGSRSELFKLQAQSRGIAERSFDAFVKSSDVEPEFGYQILEGHGLFLSDASLLFCDVEVRLELLELMKQLSV